LGSGKRRVLALVLLIAGLALAAAGAQGLAWDGAELVQAARAGERVELVFRLNQPAKVNASPWGGASSAIATGLAWRQGAEQGTGVPARLYLEGEAPEAGAIIRTRARLALSERTDTVRVVAHGIGHASAARPDGWRGLIYDLRAGLAARVEPLEEGIALGDVSRIDADLDAALKTTSLTHLTAVSGAHVAIVLGCVLGLAALAGLPRWAVAVLAACTLAGFVALIGPGPSVLRAVLMGLVAVAGAAFGKTRQALAALAAAVLAILLANPWLARSYGLLLSALATAGLIVLAPPLALALERRWPRLPRALAEGIALTASAQLLCAPVIAMFAGQISLTALPANLMAGPAVPVATIAAMLALVLGPVSAPLAGAAAVVGNGAAWYIAAVARWVASWPLAAVAWPSGVGGLLLAVGASAALVWLGWWLSRRRGWVRLVAAGVALAIFIAAGPARAPVGRVFGRGAPADWIAAVCDVGQGTAVAIRAGPAAAVLIDAGPSDGGVGECLDQLSVRRLEAVVLTHFHTDHAGGLADALSGRAVGEVVYGPICGQSEVATAVLRTAQEGGASLRQVTGTDPVRGHAGLTDLTVYPSALAVLCPDNASGVEDSAANDAGLAVLAESGGVPIWALGDLEEAGQSALLAALRRDGAGSGQAGQGQAGQGQAGSAGIGSSDMLYPGAGGLVVVAHHGSASQSERLARALAPRIAVMSAGRDNPYGHPRRETLDLYGSLATVKRTDQDGLIALTAQDLGG
jgi:competence protein ComEC